MALRTAIVMLVAALAVLVSAMRAPDLHVVLAHAPAALKVHREQVVVDRAISPSVDLTKASAPRGDRFAPPAVVAIRSRSGFVVDEVTAPALAELPLDPPARQRARLMVFLN